VLDRGAVGEQIADQLLGLGVRYLAVAKVDDWQNLTWLDDQEGIVVLERWNDLVVFRVD
jgi:hypothetical protein